MRTLLLLLLSLMTGCEAVSNVKGCRDGWVEFTCNYQRSGFTLIKSGHTLMQSSKNNEWETTNSVSLYRDTNNKKVRVLIKKLKQEDFAEYQCKKQGSNFDTVKLEKDRGCQGQFIQTVYRTAQTTITCDYPRNRDESDVLFFCKENKITCEDILSTESSPKSSETFTLTKTNTGFTVSISKVSSHHAGVYWCGVKPNKGRYRAGFRKIQLEVKGPPIMSPNSPTTASPSLTQPTTASHESFDHTVLNFALCLSLDLLVFLLMACATYFLIKRYELCKKNKSGE